MVNCKTPTFWKHRRYYPLFPSDIIAASLFALFYSIDLIRSIESTRIAFLTLCCYYKPPSVLPQQVHHSRIAISTLSISSLPRSKRVRLFRRQFGYISPISACVLLEHAIKLEQALVQLVDILLRRISRASWPCAGTDEVTRENRTQCAGASDDYGELPERK